MPSVVEAFVEERLVKAEIAYEKGTMRGVEEESVARFINSLMDNMGAPSYSRTCVSQVRVLRMSLAISSPVFMGRGMASGDFEVGDSINSFMSPLQAAHLAAVLIDQKFLNPDYQVEPSEWEATHHKILMDRMRQAQAAARSDVPHRFYGKVRHNPRGNEMRELAAKRLSTMTVTDAFDLANEAFAMLN